MDCCVYFFSRNIFANRKCGMLLLTSMPYHLKCNTVVSTDRNMSISNIVDCTHVLMYVVSMLVREACMCDQQKKNYFLHSCAVVPANAY